MIALLEIIFLILFLVTFRGSVVSLVRGIGLPIAHATQAVRQLDNIYRFMAGAYLGVSGMCLWLVFTMDDQGTLVYLVALMVFLAGMGRVVSFLVYGIPDRRYRMYAIAELSLSVLIVVLNYVRLQDDL